MANPSSRSWGPTQPSAAFLIKCAKEKEKLRNTLQSQLQDHMLYMFQNNVFSDTLIGINSDKFLVSENQLDQNLELPRLICSHKSLLKVRAPTFYKFLLQHEESTLGATLYNSFLGELELKEFLKRVYTDDDIRKHECEALRLSKKYIELYQNKGSIKKHRIDVDEFDKDSVTSTCTDNFVTPKTSPVSPEKKLDVSDMFKGAQIRSKRNNKTSPNDMITDSSKTLIVNGGSKYSSNSQERDLNNINGELGLLSTGRNRGNSIVENGQQKTSTNCTMNKSFDDILSSDQESDHDDSSNVGSMVRSNTFDLETQGSLEETIDDSVEWCSRPSSSSYYKEDNGESNKESLSSRRLDGTGFFLHDHTPSPKSNIFKHGFPKEPIFINGHDMDQSTPNVHFRRNDGSLSDSGFMSHSTFSVISDTLPNSIASSLIMSCDDISSPSNLTTSNGTEISMSKLEKSRHLSGSMFPFYIDINNLPLTPKRDKKSSPSHTYMYIDARSPKRSMSMRKKKYLNASYEEFFSEFELGSRKKESLIKAQSTSQLDMYGNDHPLHENLQKLERKQAQSCYMYVDLDSVKNTSNKGAKGTSSMKPELPPVSMFINLEDTNESSVTSDSLSNKEKSSSTDKDGLMTYSIDVKEDASDIKPTHATKNVDAFETNLNFFPLSKSRSTRSSSATEFISANSLKFANKNEISRKSHSAHRYSDGVYYESIYNEKISQNLCNKYDEKVQNISKNFQKDLKIFSHSAKLLHDLGKLEDPIGSCSSLEQINPDEKLLYDDKFKWKSTGDMSRKNTMNGDDTGLLPMSPILRRKTRSKELPKSAPAPIIKASTKPQDIDAMTFPLKEDSLKLNSKIKQDDLKTDHLKKSEKSDDSKSSSESSKCLSDVQYESAGKDKTTDRMNKSGSSLMTQSGGDSSSEKHMCRDKEKIIATSMSLSGEFEDDAETIYSEVSDVSSSFGNMSGIASLERRWKESQTQPFEFNKQNILVTQQMLEACSKVGEDLLRMFLEEIDTDISIEVEGKEIRAHRCILSARCKYFANLLHTSSPDRNSSIISLEGFSFCSVHFALCHIYSGAMNIPKDCNISELALLADMLNLESLTQVIVFHLKMNFCHFFHRPCLHCTQGVVECLPLAVVCGLAELRDKCIYWLGKYFTCTWPNKSFAGLSEELQDLCYNVTAQNISVDTIIDMTLNCDRLITTLPQVKWTEPIFGMVSRLLQECMHFIAQNFNQILKSESFLALGKGQSWNMAALEEDIISSIELTTPDVACKSYVTVNQLLLLTESSGGPDYCDFTQNFVDLLHKIARHCERYLIQNANKVVHCQNWSCLSAQVQKRIRDAAVIVFEFEKPTAPPPRLSSLQRQLRKHTISEETSSARSTYPKKGRSPPKKCQKDLLLTKSCISANTPEMSDNSIQHCDADNWIKKIVSPIKEEANNSVDNSSDVRSGFGDTYNSPKKPNLMNKVYVDAHEEDSLRDLQELPQDQTQSPKHNSSGLDSNHTLEVLHIDTESPRSPAHCSDNPDSLEANDISSDSKDDIDVSIFADDGSSQEKGVIETPEVINKNFEFTEPKKDVPHHSLEMNPSSLPKPMLPGVSKEKVPHLQPLIPQICDKIPLEKSPTKKLHGKSLVPLAKPHNSDEKPLKASIKDLVAEIDADSRMVSHCLQEAEMLEQQLSRKLQRQHQDGSSYYIQSSPVKPPEHKTKSHGSRLQKASSTSQIKNLMGASARGKSPGRIIKSNASSPSITHAPRITRSSESKEKLTSKKLSQSPKCSSAQRSFKSMDSLTNAQKQMSPSISQAKQISSRSNRPKVLTTNVRTSVGSK